MTTTTGGRPASERAIIREIFLSVAVKEMQGRSVETIFQAATKENTGREKGWLEFVTEEMASLPWYEADLPDGRTPPQPRAAVELISLLATALKGDTIAPSSVNTTWAGGVAVEWHIGGIDLEISCQPDGTAEFNFEQHPGEEHEGPVAGNMAQLAQFIARLPTNRQPAA